MEHYNFGPVVWDMTTLGLALGQDNFGSGIIWGITTLVLLYEHDNLSPIMRPDNFVPIRK